MSKDRGGVPETRFTESRGARIAYQVFGSGPRDIVLISGWATHMDLMWDLQPWTYAIRRLSGLGRVVLFDNRGSGASDPVDAAHPLTPDGCVQEIIDVLNAAGCRSAVLIGNDVSVPIQCLLAVGHPERVAALVLCAGFASILDRGDGIGQPEAARTLLVNSIVDSWGDPHSAQIERWLPGQDREAERVAMAKTQRLTLSRAGARALMEMATALDVRPVLAEVQCPTLVLSRTGLRGIPSEHSRYLAAHIRGARLVEMDGTEQNLLGQGDTKATFDEIEKFLTGSRPQEPIRRQLMSVLFTDIVDSTRRAAELGDEQWREVLDRHDRALSDVIGDHHGTVVKSTGDGLLATFDSPGRALAAAFDGRAALREFGIEIRAGLHTGEIERRGEDIGGIGVHVAARILGQAGPGEVLVSGAIPMLVTGSAFRFEDRGERELRGVPGLWRLYAASPE